MGKVERGEDEGRKDESKKTLYYTPTFLIILYLATAINCGQVLSENFLSDHLVYFNYKKVETSSFIQ